MIDRLVGIGAKVRAGLVCAAFAFLAVGAGAQDAAKKATIKISGSDTMNMLSMALAEGYAKTAPSVEINVTGGGSGRGIADMMSGLNDIAQASRPLAKEEYDKAKAGGLDPKEEIIALDGLAVIVHGKNPVGELSIRQIAAIYTGAVTNWKAFGGPDKAIVVYARESNSGTYNYFKEHVLEKKDFGAATKYLAATAAIGTSVAGDEGAIGFGGIGYFAHTDGVKILAVKKTKDSPAVSPIDAKTHHPDFAAIQSGSYPISRPLYFYTPRAASGEVAKFIEWVKSPEGQAVVAKTEYIPLAASR